MKEEISGGFRVLGNEMFCVCIGNLEGVDVEG